MNKQEKIKVIKKIESLTGMKINEVILMIQATGYTLKELLPNLIILKGVEL